MAPALPKVSVVLPVYNTGSFLRASIESVLNQTYADFELIIIDDGSTDGSGQVIASYTDPRIRAFHQANQGVMASLNRGLELSRGQYIARMDHDDVSRPDRFRQQVDWLDTHHDHVVVGTTYAYIDTDNHPLGIFPALLQDEDLRRELMTKSPFGHGSTMYRAAIIREHHIRYRSTYIDDYDLWMRLATFGKMANLPEVLYLWRRRPGSIMNLHHDQQLLESRALQDAVWPQVNVSQLIGWPGWGRLQRYRNEHLTVDGISLPVTRRNAHSSLYLNLAVIFWRHRRWWPAIVATVYACLIHPIYPIQAALKLSGRISSYENLPGQ